MGRKGVHGILALCPFYSRPSQAGIERRNAAFCYPAELAHGFFYSLLGQEDPPEFIDDKFGDVILDNIRRNLNSEGWTEVDEDADPDLVILPSAFDTQFLYFYNPGYWCWYYPCWGWWYPGYFPGYVTGYETGTVLIQMTDPNGVENDEVPVVWTGTLNGLLQGSDANIIGRIDRNLDQAFTQPPFD